MPAHALTCPGCGKVLRTTAAPPAGARITCPACGRAFAPAEASPPAAAPPGRSHPRPGRRVLIAVVLVPALLGLLLLWTYGVRLDFWKPADRSDRTDPLAFIPPDANVVIGAELAALRERGRLDGVLGWFQAQAAARGMGKLAPEVDRLLRGGEAALLATTTGAGAKTVLVVRTAAEEVNRLRAAVQFGDARPGAGDVPILPFTANQGTATGWMATPGERLVLLSSDPEPVTRALAVGTLSDPPRHVAVDFRQALDGGQGWAVLLFDAAFRLRLAENQELQGKLALAGPFLGEIRSAVQRVNAATAQVDVADLAAVKVRLNLHCASPEDAATVQAGGEKLWNGPLAALVLPGFLPKALYADLRATLAFDRQAATATARARLSLPAVLEMLPAAP